MPHSSAAKRGPEPADTRDAPRIPQLLPSRAMFANERAADSLLGLLASHAGKKLPLLDQHELQRRRQQLPGHPRPVMSLEASASAMHPPVERQQEQFQQQHRSQEERIDSSFTEKQKSPLLSFLNRPNKLSVNVTSPRSVWEESPPNERLDPTASPRHTSSSTNRLAQTTSTTSSWRIHTLLSPNPSANLTTSPRASHKRRAPPTSPPREEIEVATKRPRLVRRVSSQWRQELSPPDRAKTRERIMRSLHLHCQGDYEKLVLLLSSMEEELLHIKTTSTEVYTQQAFDLSDLIEHATLER